MGFLKSLSKSIKKSAPPQSSVTEVGEVSEFGIIDAKTSVQEHAGIKRPSGQGDIARRGRRRSSEKQVMPGHGMSARDPTASVNIHFSVRMKDCRTLTEFEFVQYQTVKLVPYPATPSSIHSAQQPESNDAQGTSRASLRLGPHSSDNNLSSPVSSFSALRTMGHSVLPRGIIVTPSSPIKPVTRRDEPSSSNSAYSRSPGTYTIEDFGQSSVGSLRKDPNISSRIILDRNDSSGTAYDLGIGQPSKARRPPFFSESSTQSYSRSGLLTPEPLVSAGLTGHRSASLPIDTHPTTLPLSSPAGPSSPRFLFADDTWSDSERRGQNSTDKKVIRKTRSFSDVLSRNRKSRSDNKDSSTPQPIITWGADRKLRVVETLDTVSPPSTSQTSSPKKKSSSILRTAVDFFQFRNSRSRANSNSENEVPLSISPGDRDGLDLVFNGKERLVGSDAGFTASMSPLPIPSDSSETGNLGEEPKLRLPSHCLDDDVSVLGSWNSASLPRGRTGDSSAVNTASPSPISQFPVLSMAEESLTVDTLLLPRAKVCGSIDSPFKRPLLNSRAQSTKSLSQNTSTSPGADGKFSFWHGSRPLSEAPISRSTTIRAVRSSSSQRSSDVVTTSLSSSLRNSRQNSVDDFAAGGSEPMSILRPHMSARTPTAQVVGSPTVSFVGGTPRMSISSTTSDAESGKGLSRPRGYTSVSQDNIHNALSLPSVNIKSSRPRSSTLFSTTPGWLTTGTLNSPEKKRTSVMRRLSAGLIGNLDEHKRIPLQTPARDSDASAPEYSSSGDPVLPIAPDLPREAPGRQPEASIEEWMAQLSQILPRSSLASFLASKQTPDFQGGLHSLLKGFHFDNLPLDIALRRFLLEMALPREAQQIDRVLEAFAQRYNACHPGLFRDPDHAYVLAFSLIMLHTDVYNRHNKQKMTKAEYVRNTRLDGVAPAVLETFHENTCYAEFTFADRVNSDMDRHTVSRPRNNRRSTLFFTTKASNDALTTSLDGYGFQAAVIAGNVAHLQVPSSKWIPKNDPMSYIGSWTTIDEDWVERRFIKAPAIEVVKPATSSTMTSRGRRIYVDNNQHQLLVHEISPVVLRLKVVKDSIWALALVEQIDRLEHDYVFAPGTLLLPTFTDFKPDEVIGLAGSAAIFDRSYTKNENTFRLAMPHGLEYVLQASDESEMNEWVTLINWSAASKTLNIPTTSTNSFASSPRSSQVNENQNDASVINETREESALSGNTLSERNSPFIGMLSLNSANKDYDERYTSLTSKINEELRIARNLELLAILSQGSKEHIESLFQLMAENIRRWRAELAKLKSIHIRQHTPPGSGTNLHKMQGDRNRSWTTMPEGNCEKTQTCNNI
ncbi:hypothetical protein QFC21_004291 [Naganishia friedmannii]|uniref:Uncharacterized protein n=1 Tax=Naganishia friedmannii TaxID=89922 RepID=A0ACC2VHV0_9TREE|nr:hypothetical protein QFC21_004291 [Naganishia friedmannii]